MARKKGSFNKEDAIANILGFPTIPYSEQEESIDETKEGDKQKTSSGTSKKKGRPKSSGEIKEKKTITVSPSLYAKATDKAYSEGKNMSALISELLENYISE